MGKKGGSAPAPDPALGAAAKESVKIGRDQFNWVKNTIMPEVLDYSRTAAQEQLAAADTNRIRSDQEWANYIKSQPVYDKMLLDSLGYSELNPKDAKALSGSLSGYAKQRLQQDYEAKQRQLQEQQQRDQYQSGTKTTPAASNNGLPPGAVVAPAGGNGNIQDEIARQRMYASFGINAYGGGQGFNSSGGKADQPPNVWEYNAATGKWDSKSLSQYTPNSSATASTSSTSTTPGDGLLGNSYYDKKRSDLQAEYQAGLADVNNRDALQADLYQKDRAARENYAGLAGVDVQRSSDIARQQAERELGRRGVDPNSGRYAALQSQAGVQTAAAKAGAMTNARGQYIAQRKGQQGNVLNVGRGMPATAFQAGGLSMQGNTSAPGLINSGVGTSIGAINSSRGWYQTGISGLNQQYQNQLTQYNANKRNNSGMFGVLGSALGAWASGGTSLAAGGGGALLGGLGG